MNRFLQTHECILDPTLGKTPAAVKVEEKLVSPGPAWREVLGLGLLRKQSGDQAARLSDFKSLGIELPEPLHAQGQAMPVIGQVGPAQVGAIFFRHLAPQGLGGRLTADDAAGGSHIPLYPRKAIGIGAIQIEGHGRGSIEVALVIPIPSSQGKPPRKRIQVQFGLDAEILQRKLPGSRAAGPNQRQVQLEGGLSSIYRYPGHIVEGSRHPILRDKRSRDLDHRTNRIGLFHLHPIFAPGSHPVSDASTPERDSEMAAFQDPGSGGEIVAPILIHPDLVQQLLGLSPHDHPEGSGDHFHPLPAPGQPDGRGEPGQGADLAQEIHHSPVGRQAGGEMHLDPAQAPVLRPTSQFLNGGGDKSALAVHQLEHSG